MCRLPVHFTICLLQNLLRIHLQLLLHKRPPVNHPLAKRLYLPSSQPLYLPRRQHSVRPLPFLYPLLHAHQSRLSNVTTPLRFSSKTRPILTNLSSTYTWKMAQNTVGVAQPVKSKFLSMEVLFTRPQILLLPPPRP